MTIDTKLLASDPGYWDECGAPEDATHYVAGKSQGLSGIPWEKWGADFRYSWRGRWHPETLHNRSELSRIYENVIPRPQKPEVEWDKDLPDVGAEKQYYNSEMNEVRECVVIAHRHGCAIVEDQDGETYEAVPPNNFVQTKEQRQRDELLELVLSGGILAEDGKECQRIVDDIIAEGWKKDV